MDKGPLNPGRENKISGRPSDPRSPFLIRCFYLVGILISTLLIVRLAKTFLAIPEADLITWDQAARANTAVQLAKEFSHLQMGSFILHIFKLNWWPPLHPLLIFPFCLIFGPSLFAFVLPSFIAYPLAIFSLLFLYENLSAGRIEDKILGFSVLFSLAITSPFLLGSATRVMTEIIGIALTGLVLGFYFRGGRYRSAAFYKICAVLCFGLWTLKYSYGIFAGMILVFLELQRSRDALRSLMSRVRLRAFLKPVLFPAYLMILLVLWVALTGGVRVHWGKIRFSLSDIYNPLMYLYQYIALLFLIRLKRHWSQIKRTLEFGQRELLLWGALPIILFLALPDKIKAIIKNIEAGKRAKSEFSFGQISYYFRSIAEDYSLFVPVGILVLLLLGFVLFKFRSAPLGIRWLIVYFAAGLIYLIFFFNFKESRYLIAFAPALWVSSAWALESLLGRMSRKIKNVLAVSLVSTTLIMIFLTPLPIQKALDQPWARGSHYPEIFRSLIDPVLEMTRDSPKIFISGIRDANLGPLIELELQIGHYRQKNYKAVFKDFNNEREARTAFQNMMAEKEIDMIILFVRQEAESQDVLLNEAQKISNSGRFELVQKIFYQEPFPAQLIFFKKI